MRNVAQVWLVKIVGGSTRAYRAVLPCAQVWLPLRVRYGYIISFVVVFSACCKAPYKVAPRHAYRVSSWRDPTTLDMLIVPVSGGWVGREPRQKRRLASVDGTQGGQAR